MPSFVLYPPTASRVLGGLALLGIVALSGCQVLPKAEAEPSSQQSRSNDSDRPITVNVAQARSGSAQPQPEYTGTTQPLRLVSLRSQVEGQLLDLSVTVGDRVSRGQTLAQVDSTVLRTNVAEAEAEVAARESEVAQASTSVSDAQTQVNRADAELKQAQSDLKRIQYLAQQGAIPEQQVEQAQTRVTTAQQTLRSAQEQVRTRAQAVTAAQRRVKAQQAVLSREQERQSFAVLTSAVNGLVIEQPIEPGSLVQPGTEVLKLGDFSQVKVVVQISERELADLRVGQAVQVRLDALPNRQLRGQVSKISPAADPIARLIPIEITVPNPDGQIGSGLLARVTFSAGNARSRVLIPETALQIHEPRRGGGGKEAKPQKPATQGTLFVIDGTGESATVSARSITLGQRRDGQVEVISGLQAGERYVARSSQALKSGDSVKLSILSGRSEGDS